jgi:hypothetical protein
MSFLKILEKVADVITDGILNLNPETKFRRSLKYKQQEVLDRLSASYCKEASYYMGREITEEELIQKGREFNARYKSHGSRMAGSRSSTAPYRSDRHLLAHVYDSGCRSLPAGRK